VTEHIRRAAEVSADVVFNPAPAIPVPMDVFKQVGHLIMNETEAAIMSHRDADAVDPSDVGLLSSISGEFLEAGVQTVIITLGGSGVFYRTLAEYHASVPGRIIPARKTTVVDTTAAGDTFVGAYAVAVAHWRRGLHGWSEWADFIPEALEFATRAASKTVERAGAQASIPFKGEVPGK
jgi:ribokinase